MKAMVNFFRHMFGRVFCWHSWVYSGFEVIGGSRVSIHRCHWCPRVRYLPYYQIRNVYDKTE